MQILKRSIWISILINIILIGIIVYLGIDKNKATDKRIQELDSLNQTIHKDNDSIVISIKADKETIRILNEDYEITKATIVNQSFTSDKEFFSNYLTEQCGRLYDCNNSDSIKAN